MLKEEKWDIGLLGVFFLTHKLLMFKNENLPFRINIPSFQHSIIPCPPASPERPSASAEALRCRAGLAMAGRYEAKAPSLNKSL